MFNVALNTVLFLCVNTSIGSSETQKNTAFNATKNGLKNATCEYTLGGGGEGGHLFPTTYRQYTQKLKILKLHFSVKFIVHRFSSDNILQSSVVGSSYVTARYIRDTLNYSGKVYMIGSSGLQQELEAAGMKPIGLGVRILLFFVCNRY